MNKIIMNHMLAVMGMTVMAVAVTTIRYVIFMPAFI